MQQRRVQFEHEGHRFEAVLRMEEARAEPRVHWDVWMDGALALEFRGEYPYRDEDIRKRILEWYGIQRPIG